MQKRVAAMVVAGIMAIGLTGCGAKKNEAPQTQTQVQTQAQAQTQPGNTSDLEPVKTSDTATTTAPPAKPGEWCIAGQVWNTGTWGQSDATAEAKVIGLTQFKDKEFCQAQYLIDEGGKKSEYDYYFTQDAKDIWAVITTDGQKQELHLLTPS